MNHIALTLIGIASVALAGSVVAQTGRSREARLISPDEKARFERQSPAKKRQTLIDLRRAATCVAAYARRDGVREATAAAKGSDARFYTHVADGFQLVRTVPGIASCTPAFTTEIEEAHFSALAEPEAYFGPRRPRGFKIQIQCGAKVLEHAAAFNRTLATMRPDVLRAACPTGHPD